MPPRMDELTFAEQLGKAGLCVWPGFLDPEATSDIREDLELIQKAQGFRRAGTGQGKGKEVRDLVRRDEVHWLDRGTANPVQSMLWDKLDSLKQTLNRTLFLGLSEFEGHYAVYPAGGFYKRHLDCFKQDNSRVVSLILYLNPDWKPLDGGQLRVHGAGSPIPEPAGSGRYTEPAGSEWYDVEPIGGRLVCFLSAEIEHEVLPSHAARLSFTGWFKRTAVAQRV